MPYETIVTNQYWYVKCYLLRQMVIWKWTFNIKHKANSIVALYTYTWCTGLQFHTDSQQSWSTKCRHNKQEVSQTIQYVNHFLSQLLTYLVMDKLVSSRSLFQCQIGQWEGQGIFCAARSLSCSFSCHVTNQSS